MITRLVSALVLALSIQPTAGAVEVIEQSLEDLRGVSRLHDGETYYGQPRRYPVLQASAATILEKMIAVDSPRFARESGLRERWYDVIDALIAFAGTPPFEGGFTKTRYAQLFALHNALERAGRTVGDEVAADPGWQKMETLRDELRAALVGEGSLAGFEDKLRAHSRELSALSPPSAFAEALDHIHSGITSFHRDGVFSVSPKVEIKRLITAIDRRRLAAVGPRAFCARALVSPGAPAIRP